MQHGMARVRALGKPVIVIKRVSLWQGNGISKTDSSKVRGTNRFLYPKQAGVEYTSRGRNAKSLK